MKLMKKTLLLIFIVVFMLNMMFTAYAQDTPKDGTYKVGLTFTGGTGRVTAQSPTDLTVSHGKMTLTIILSSSNYPYIVVNGTQYNNTAGAGKSSTFKIPISALDTPINIIGRTEAMSTPHDIDYTITVSSEGVKFNTDENQAQDTKDKNTGDDGGKKVDNNKNENVKNPSDNKVDEKTDDEGVEDSQKQSVNGVYIESGEVNSDEITVTSENGTKSVNINASQNTSIKFPVSSFAKLSGTKVIISTKNGSVTFAENTFDGFADKAKGSIILTVEDITADAKYKDLNYDKIMKLGLNDEEGNELFGENSDGNAIVTLPYTDNVASENQVKVYYISGSEKKAVDSTYDIENKTVSFEVTHFSDYAVVQEVAAVEPVTNEPEENGNNYLIIIILAVLIIAVVSVVIIYKSKRSKK